MTKLNCLEFKILKFTTAVDQRSRRAHVSWFASGKLNRGNLHLDILCWGESDVRGMISTKVIASSTDCSFHLFWPSQCAETGVNAAKTTEGSCSCSTVIS